MHVNRGDLMYDYIKKDELEMILSELPEYHVVERHAWLTRCGSGKRATVPTTAKVAHAQIHSWPLKGVSDIPNEDVKTAVEAIITPERFDGLDLGRKKVVQQPSKSQLTKLWGPCSGSSAFSARATISRKREKWVVDKLELILSQPSKRRETHRPSFSVIGVFCLHTTSNRVLWGNRTTKMTLDLLRTR